MQKQLSRAGRASSKSSNKGVQKKGATKTLVANTRKRTSNKPTHGSRRRKIHRFINPLLPLEKGVKVLGAAATAGSESLMTTAENIRTLAPSRAHFTPTKPASVLNATAAAIPTTLTTTAEGTKRLVSPSPLLLWKNQAGVLTPTGIAIPQASTAISEPCWRPLKRKTTIVLPTIMSLFGWHAYRLRMQQKRMALQMLVVNGSVRPGSVEFRYSTDPEDAGTLCRSFAVHPTSEALPPTPLEALYARWRARGIQFVQSLRLQEAYARLQSRGLQLLEWLRRELSARSYPSRV